MKYFLLLLTTIFAFSACKTKLVKDDKFIGKGTIKIGIDDAVKPILDAQISAYSIRYPDAIIDKSYLSEQKAIQLLFKDSLDVIAITRGFNKNELDVLKSRELDYTPARMALDAIVMIRSKSNGDTTLTLDELKGMLISNNSNIKLVFDKSNSSNLNTILEKFNLTSINNKNVFAANGNQNVFDIVKSNPNAIGFVGYNWISDDDDPKAKSLKNSINIISVSADNKNFYKPNFKNLKARKYPLERFIYLHTLYHVWGVEDGFIRFACSKVGQLVTDKMGLVPFYIIPKEFLLNTEPLNEKDDKKKKPLTFY